MAIIKRLSFYDFKRAFEDYGREEQFSLEGLEELYNFLEDEPQDEELDVIGLCCEFTEYESLEALQEDYEDIQTLDDLANKTFYLQTHKNSIIILNY